MLKSSLFAKRPRYSSDKKYQFNPNIELRKLSVGNTITRNSTRVLGPQTQPVAAAVQNVQNQSVATGLFAFSQNSLLRNYQAEVARQAELISNQRRTIKKMVEKSKDMQSLLKDQHGLVDDFRTKNQKLKVPN